MTRKEKKEKRIQETLNYIESYTAQHGYAPSVRDICEALGVKSTSTVFSDLRELEEAGHISSDEKKSRAIRLTDNIEQALSTIQTHCRKTECSECSMNRGGCRIAKALTWK